MLEISGGLYTETNATIMTEFPDSVRSYNSFLFIFFYRSPRFRAVHYSMFTLENECDIYIYLYHHIIATHLKKKDRA